MTPVPIDLPVRPSEAAVLADLVVQHLEGRPLNDDLRNRLAARAASLEMSSIRPYFGSLVRDTLHRGAFYLAVDGLMGASPLPLLLHLTQVSAPSNALFPKALLVGRMRPSGGREVVVNAIPFGPGDTGNIRAFAGTLDRAFLPRPQGALAALAVRCNRPESDLPVAIDAFRRILRNTGENWASLEAPYDICLWAVIRAGWREGYSVEDVGDFEHTTRISIDISQAFGTRISPADDSWRPERLGRPFQIGDAAYAFAPDEVSELRSMFGAGLALAEDRYDYIRRAKSAAGAGRSFDFELALIEAGAPISPKQLLFCLHWLKSRGRAAQLVAPPLSAGAVAEMVAVARFYNTTLSFEIPGPGESLLDEIGAATAGRVNCRVRGEFDAPYLDRLVSRLRG